MNGTEAIGYQPNLIQAAWRYRMAVAVGAVVGLVLALAFLIVSPPRVAAVTSIVLEQATDPSTGISRSAATSERFITNEVEVLRSAIVAETASDLAGAHGDEIGARQFLSRTDVSTQRDSDVVTVVFHGSSKDEAIVGADALVDAYQQVRLDQKAAEAESILERLAASTSLLERELTDINTRLAAASAVGRLATQFGAELEQAVARLTQAADQLEEATDPDQRSLLIAEIEAARSQLLAIDLAIDLSSRDPDYSALLRERQQVLERIANVESQRTQVAIDSETIASSVAFRSPARVPGSGSLIGRWLLVLALGILLGTAAGLGVAYYVAVRRRAFSHREEPEEVLGTPLLAEIPHYEEEAIESPLPVMHAPRSLAAEAFRFAAVNLEVRMALSGARAALVVSSTVGEGKTSVAANTAVASAHSGKRVLLIDADFGNQALTRLIRGEVSMDPGLTELVEAGVPLQNAIHSIPVGRRASVDLLSRGVRPIVAPDFFQNPMTQKVLAEVMKEYDLVLIDAPPLLQVAYSASLARIADAAVVVVPHGAQVRHVEETADRLQFIGVNLAGYMYTKAPLRRDMVLTEGSMKDVLGDQGRDQPVGPRARRR